MVDPKKRKQSKDDDFREYMPGYMQPELFNSEEATKDVARHKIIRQLGFILALLLIQMILFFFLIKLTLGFSF